MEKKINDISFAQKEDVDTTIPLGGVKQSGIGRDNSYHALDNYVQIKSTWIKL